jgi:hypothetical protein
MLLKKELSDGLEKFVKRIAEAVEKPHIRHQGKHQQGSGTPADIDDSPDGEMMLCHTEAPVKRSSAVCGEVRTLAHRGGLFMRNKYTKKHRRMARE